MRCTPLGPRARRPRRRDGVVRARHVVQVAHRRLDVRVAHPLLDAQDVGLGDHPRAERVAQVVEAQPSQAGAVERGHVAAAQRRAVDVAAELADERPGRRRRSTSSRSASRASAAATSRRQRHGAHLAALRRRQPAAGEAGADADERAGEVDVAPAQRDELAAAQARERRGEEDRRVLLRRRPRARAPGPPRARRRRGRSSSRLAQALDVGHRVARQPKTRARPAEDAVEDRQELVLRSRRDRQRRAPRLDRLRGDVLERQVAEGRAAGAPRLSAVVAQRRRLARAVVLDVAQPLAQPRRRTSRRVRTHAGQRAGVAPPPGRRSSQSSAVRFVK